MPKQACQRAFCGVLFLIAAGSVFGDEPTASSSQVKKVLQVELKVFDVNLDKLKALGFSWSQLDENGFKEMSFDDFLKTLEKGKSVDKALTVFQALRENDLACCLAEPTIATLDGRPASLAVGTTKLDVVPILLGDGRVRLECRLELFATQNDRFNLDTAIEVERGTTYLVSRMRTKRHATDKPHEAEILVLVKVESLNSSLQR
jgi:hypothetical protein